MTFTINNNIATNQDIRSLPLKIKYDINTILRKEFGYKIKDIMMIFEKSRDTINKWLSKVISLDTNIVSRLPAIAAKNKPCIKISVEDNSYHIYYYVKNSRESEIINIKNSLLSGDTILELSDNTFSKSTVGRLNKEVFTQDLYNEYNEKIIKHLNRYLLEYKPVILKDIQNGKFIWNEHQLIKVINILNKEGFSIKAISHILSNTHINIKFQKVIKLKQTNLIPFIAHIWCNITIARKKIILEDITESLKKIKNYSVEHIDLHTVFNEFLVEHLFESNIKIGAKTKNILYNLIDTKIYTNTPINISFNAKDIKETEISSLIYGLNYNTAKKSILDIFVDVTKSLSNVLQFHLVYNKQEKKHPMEYVSEYKIKKYLQEPKSDFNIYYSNKENLFKFKNKYDLEFHLSTTYTMTRE